MMDYMATEIVDIDRMPRGGPDASCIDRLLQTDRLEYLDRDGRRRGEEAQRDPGARVDRRVVRPEPRSSRGSRSTKWLTCPIPRSSSSAAGHGALSRKLLEWHPTAQLTVTDIELPSVQAIAGGDLGEHPRATVREMDATAIDVADRHFDLAVFVLAFHHLPPSLASDVIAEGTRVADKLLIIDLPRPPWPLHLRAVGDDAAVRAVDPVRARRRDQLAAHLQPVGAARPRRTRRPVDRHRAARRPDQRPGRGGEQDSSVHVRR